MIHLQWSKFPKNTVSTLIVYNMECYSVSRVQMIECKMNCDEIQSLLKAKKCHCHNRCWKIPIDRIQRSLISGVAVDFWLPLFQEKEITFYFSRHTYWTAQTLLFLMDVICTCPIHGQQRFYGPPWCVFLSGMASVTARLYLP